MDNFFLDLDNFNKLLPVCGLNDIMLKLPLNFLLFSPGLIMLILFIFVLQKYVIVKINFFNAMHFLMGLFLF